MRPRAHGHATWTGVTLVGLLGGCATPPPRPISAPLIGAGSYTPVTAPGAQTRRYQLGAGQSASGATLVRFENPVYPPALLARQLAPVTLVMKLVVGGDGRVLRVQPDPPAQLRQIDHADAFVAAIEICTRQWRFAPLIITTTRAENGRWVNHPEAKPFSLVYAFSFELRRGKPHTGLAHE